MLFRVLKYCIVVSIFIAFLPEAKTQGTEEFQNGITLFEAKKYKEAASAFESIISAGLFSDEVYYNLGNAYFQNKEPVKAILNYERALKLNPRLSEAKFNLKIALEEIDNEVIEVPDFFLIKMWRNTHTFFKSNIWATIYIVLLWLSVLALVYWLLGKNRNKKKQAFLLGLVSLFFTILTFFLSSSQYKWETQRNSAIVMEDTLKLKSAPQEENKAILDLQAGTKLYFIDKIGEWNKVRLNNGQLGWLKGEEGLTRI